MIKVTAKAKLNLNLHILPQKRDGLFPVHYINCELDICDILWFEKRTGAIEVVCDSPGVPEGRENLVYKAARLLQGYGRTNDGVRVRIEKHIPVRAGLGGGSADAAATLKVLTNLWGVKISKQELLTLARKVGMDVCYSLTGGLASVEGDGSAVTSLTLPLPKVLVLVLVPLEEKPSTQWSFRQLSNNRVGTDITKTDRLQKALKERNQDLFFSSLHNDFEMPLASHFPIIGEMRDDLLGSGAKAINLCGAGLAVAGFFSSKKDAVLAQQAFKKKYKQAILGGMQ